MKIAIVSKADAGGGAARAAHRLFCGLRDIGESARFVVQEKSGRDSAVAGPSRPFDYLLSKVAPILDGTPLLLYPHRERLIFSPAFVSLGGGRLLPTDVDVVNLHWITGGFLSVNDVARVKQALVWTFHDAWPLTGGCHILRDCSHFTEECGQCPQLRSAKKRDLSWRLLRKKRRLWSNRHFTVVTDGQWLADQVRRSPLFQDSQVHVINPGLDLRVYRPLDKIACRNILDLPCDKTLVMFGAMSADSDRNKGYHLLKDALERLHARGTLPNAHLVVFGGTAPADPLDLGFEIHHLGCLNDDVTLAMAYSAADVMVVPSLQEAFGQTASEALACGTPVACFGATGLLDIVDHKTNGYHARPYDVSDLGDGIAWIVSDASRLRLLSDAARQKCIREFDSRLVAHRYAEVFRETLEREQARRTK